MSQNRDNTAAFQEAEQYSQFLIENLPDGMLPEQFARNVSDFTTGTTLNIKTVGTRTIQDVQEGVAMTFNPIDTGNVTLSITDYIGDAWSISDELREDAMQVEQLSAAMAMESTRAVQEAIETSFLTACNAAQTANEANNVNGVKHRFTANGTSRAFELMDIAYMKYAFDKANVPAQGRVLLVDPIVELTIDASTSITSLANNPMFEGLIQEGWARDHKFLKNIFGFDIYTSNRLPTVGVEGSLTDREGNTTASVAGDIANIAMCIADDNTRPMMRADRRLASVEGWRENELREDRFQTSARYGFGAQRVDTLGAIISSATVY